MKKTLRTALLVAIAITMATTTTSCKKDDEKTNNNTNSTETTFKGIAEQYVNSTIIYTYTQLASNTEKLVTDLETLKANKTQENLVTVANTFIEARKYWEMSEAFLFGPATSYGIDPHIDSWPLDQERFNALMGNANQLAHLNGEDADVVANGLEATLLGFHGLEYVIFKAKENMDAERIKDINEINDNMLTYAIAVAGDLRNCTYRLEVSWAGENAPQRHIDKLNDLEWEYTVNGNDKSYGANMLNAGNAGSTYVSFSHVMQEIVNGCASIADEVGAAKIGTAYNGEDADYIESPYSKNSITDFRDNILSIQNSYMGGIEGVNRNEAKSLHNYMKNANAAIDTKIMNAIDNAIDKIYNGMPKPFVDHITDARNGEAIEACEELVEALGELYSFLGGETNK